MTPARGIETPNEGAPTPPRPFSRLFRQVGNTEKDVSAFIKGYGGALVLYQQNNAAESKAGRADTGLRTILHLIADHIDVEAIFVSIDKSFPIQNRRFEVRLHEKKFVGHDKDTAEPDWLDHPDTWSKKLKAHSKTPGLIAAIYIKLARTENDTALKLLLIETLFERLINTTFELALTERISNAAKAVAESPDRRFGSIISSATKTLSRALRTTYGFFITLDRDVTTTCYFTSIDNSNKAMTCDGPQVEIVGLNQLLAGTKSCFLESVERILPLTRVGSLKNDISIADSTCLVVPVSAVSGTVIGCFIGLWSSAPAPLGDHHLATLDLWADEIKLPTTYLFQRSSQKMIIDPIFASRNTRIEIGKCCVLMPFTESWSNRIWNKVIRPRLEDIAVRAVRADDLYGHDVMEDIWEMINTSEFIVADITGRNANVFYELGIAHTLGKRVVLLAQSTEDIPFDLNRYRHIIYQDNIDGAEYLASKLQETILDLQKS